MNTDKASATAPVQPIVRLLDAITFDVVHGKEVPLLYFPDGTRIHLAPYKIPDNGQDPTVVLMRWLRDWCNHIARQPLSDAYFDLHQWVRLAKWQREEMPHNTPVCPNAGSIEETEAIRQRIQNALIGMKCQEEVPTKEVTRAYSAPEEDKPLLPPWHKD